MNPSQKTFFSIQSFWRIFKKNPMVFFSILVLGVFIFSALAAPLIAPYDPYDKSILDIMDAETPPSWDAEGNKDFWLGTDEQGRDLLSAIFYGVRISLLIGFCAVLLQIILGIVIGLLAGYYGGFLDSFLMRLADIQLSFSTLMIAIIFLAVFQALFGLEYYNKLALLILILVIGISEWPQYARTVRSSTLAEKKKEYVEAARVMSYSKFRIMFRHILPNCLSPVLVISTIQIANAIISEAALSFLGLGMPADKPSLGTLIKNGFEYIFSGSWWITVIPGIVLILIVFVINILGDWLRDVLNPKLK